MKKPQHIFSLQEANRMIPHLDSRLRILIQNKENCDRRHDTLFLHDLIIRAEDKGGSRWDVSSALDQDFKQLEGDLEAMEKDIEEINRLGCILRDLDSGAVELPGNLDGETVYFCWKLGETSINYYRTPDSRKNELCAIY